MMSDNDWWWLIMIDDGWWVIMIDDGWLMDGWIGEWLIVDD